MKQLFYCLILLFCFSCKQNETVKFAVCTDVHQDLIHDAEQRLSEFISSSEDNNVDYIIQLGDFCMPKDENNAFLNTWNSFQKPAYHVLGNHDMDISDKETVQQFWGMKQSYYSFDQGDFHFVVLDLNYFMADEKFVSYNNGNYYAHAKTRCYISPEQLQWLKSDLENTDKLTVVFSHQSIENKDGAKNKDEIFKVFAEANKTNKKVIACFSGHDHSDTHRIIEGVHYVGLNSSSYAWVGQKMEYSGRFSKEVEEKYSNLKYTLPYEKSVYAIIEINSNGEIIIEGVESGFIKPGPQELGAKSDSYTASISNRILKF